MCLLCGNTGGSHAVSLTERPSHELAGLWWSGTHAQAAAGAIRRVIAEVKAFSDGRQSAWRSPIVGLSRNDRTDGFDYFTGVSVEADEALPASFERLAVAEGTFAGSWHGPQDGEVVEHYGRMIAWLEGSGWAWDRSIFHHREEYPPDHDPEAPPALRLMLPVMRG